MTLKELRREKKLSQNDLAQALGITHAAVSLLEREGFLFKKVVATENVELTNRYGVKQAPTLVVLGAGDEYTKFKGVSEIKGMLTARQAV